jgi:hypothetical protein
MPEPGMGGSQDTRSGSGNSGSSSSGENQGGGGGNQGGNDGRDDRGMSPGRSQAQFGTTEFAGKTPQQAQNEINRGGGSDQAQAVQRAIAAQQAAQARAQAAAQAEAARQDQLAFAREQSLSQPSPSTNYLSSSPFATGSSPVRGVKSSIGPVPEETLSDFLNARGADFNPVFTADGTIVDNIPGSYDPTKETYEDEGDFLTDNRNFSQSEYERIAGITDTDPFGNNPVAGSSTMFGRGIETVANKLGLNVDKRGNLTKGQQDFIRDNAFDRYNDPFGEAKMFSTMRNFNLSDAEKAEYAKQQRLQQTSTPSRVQTYADRARQLGEDPSRYQQSNTIRSGLSEGDLTTLGPVVGRPRDMSDPEIAARLGLAATPLGLPVAAAEALFGLNRELGIEGQLGPDGKPFVSAEGQGGLGQLFNVATGGAGTKAIDRASQIATGLINRQPDIPGLTSGLNSQVDVGIYDRPNFLERMFGGESSYNERYAPYQNFDQGDNGGDGPVVRDPVNPPSDDTSEVIDPALFAQEKYAGLSGPTVFDPTMYLGPNYRRPTFGLGGIPTRNV